MSHSNQHIGPSGPYYKRRKFNNKDNNASQSNMINKNDDNLKKVIVKFIAKDEINNNNDNNESKNNNILPQLEIPIDSTTDQLQTLINQLLKNEESQPYSFFINEDEIANTVIDSLNKHKMSAEVVLPILYQPQAIFRVRRVNRCTASLPGHTEPVLHVHFSPDGRNLASGSGDATVRLWDVNTETPLNTLRGHQSWVMAVCWSPTGHLLASASMDKTIRVWDPKTGKRIGKPLKGHTKCVTCLSWEPLQCRSDYGDSEATSPSESIWDGCSFRLASGSKDGQIKIWDTTLKRCLVSMSGHTMGIQSIQWGGEGFLYTASQDRSIRVWDTRKSLGKLIRVLDGHAHWVNTLSLSTSYVLRTGPYDHTQKQPTSRKVAIARAQARYEDVMKVFKTELLVSGSDDFTLILWNPTKSKKPLVRMTGHQQPVNYVCYSPDGRYIASASFDNSVRLWNGLTGKFIAVFRGHVQSVYQCIFSPDSRMLVSSSKDSTIKVWDIKNKKLKSDLPGHADEVYAVDWSPDGLRVASGGKDTLLRVWRS